MLAAAGFESVVESAQRTAQMAGSAAMAALADAGVDPADVKAVLLVTESLWDAAAEASGPYGYLSLRDEFLREVVLGPGLGRAEVYANWMAGCGNLTPSLSVARGLANSPGDGCLLVVCADRATPGRSRLTPNGAAVFGDTAAACLLGRADAGLRLADVILCPSADLLALRGQDRFAATTRALRAAVEALDAEVAARAGQALREFDTVVFENFSPVLVKFCCQALGLPAGVGCTPSLAAFGHTFSSDLLISLRMLAREGAPAGRLAAVSISSWALGALIVDCG
jgi:3-oxoacyl-[acyl-carrier-protein] synthase III